MAYKHLRARLGTVMGERTPAEAERAERYGFPGEALYALLWWGSTANYRSH